MRLTSSVSLILLPSLLSACSVGPDYHRPEVKAPVAFMGAAAVEARPASSPAALEAWWQGFNDPLLTRLVTRALESNLDLAVATARVTQARASLRSANAALLPSGQVTASAAHAHESLQTPEGRLLNATPGFDRDGELYQAGIGASWEIDLFGGLRRDQEAARAEYQASAAGVSAARLTVAAETADTYITIRSLQSRIAIAQEQVKTQQQLVATVKLQYEKGIAAELQFHQAEGALSQVEATVPVLEAALESAMNAMDVLLGDQPCTNRSALLAPQPIPVAPAIQSAGGPADLLRRRPDLIVAERKLAASNARIGSAISEYYPKFTLSGLMGTATTAAGGFLAGGANNAQGVFGLRWRLFDFGRVDAEIKAAKGQNAEALASYRLAVLRASEDVEDAFSALVKREAQEQALARGEASLATARKQSFVAYKGGVVSLIEVLDADSRLLETRDSRAVAQTESAHAAVASFRALGGGWAADKG
jgi:NodT family efflux transporter outer membrane factor (OMF) lipoprotein